MLVMIQPPRLTQERSRVGVVNAATVWPSWRTDFEEVFCRERNLPMENLCKILKFYSNIGFQNDLFITKSVNKAIFSTGHIFFQMLTFWP